MRWLSFLGLLAVVGCGQSPPIVSHGKPISHWVDALKDPDGKVRRKAVIALGPAAAKVPEAKVALLGAISDSDPDVRYEVCLAVLNLGTAAGTDAIEVLEKAVRDPDARVKAVAMKALERIRGG